MNANLSPTGNSSDIEYHQPGGVVNVLSSCPQQSSTSLDINNQSYGREPPMPPSSQVRNVVIWLYYLS